ncbi:MAG: type II toxin-antitoxin system RelE/ParE family toxin [bacterium]
MKYSLIIHPRAEADLAKTFLWYESKGVGLGSQFIYNVEAAVAFISRHPLALRKYYKEYRRALVRRFPYGVFYVVDEAQISILSVMHLAQNPEQIFEILGE